MSLITQQLNPEQRSSETPLILLALDGILLLKAGNMLEAAEKSMLDAGLADNDSHILYLSDLSARIQHLFVVNIAYDMDNHIISKLFAGVTDSIHELNKTEFILITEDVHMALSKHVNSNNLVPLLQSSVTSDASTLQKLYVA